jgi:hypothetical protein
MFSRSAATSSCRSRAAVEHEVQPPARNPGFQVVHVRRVGLAARGVPQLVRPCAALELESHRPQRRDADATGDQDGSAVGRVDPEMIARQRGVERVADRHPVVHPCGPAAPVAACLHRDLVALARRGVAAERELAHAALRQA